MDSTRNQGRDLRRKALAPAAPSAAAKARGKQQTIVARELKIAPSEAEMPDPRFMSSGSRVPPAGHTPEYSPDSTRSCGRTVNLRVDSVCTNQLFDHRGIDQPEDSLCKTLGN